MLGLMSDLLRDGGSSQTVDCRSELQGGIKNHKEKLVRFANTWQTP